MANKYKSVKERKRERKGRERGGIKRLHVFFRQKCERKANNVARCCCVAVLVAVKFKTLIGKLRAEFLTIYHAKLLISKAKAEV